VVSAVNTSARRLTGIDRIAGMKKGGHCDVARPKLSSLDDAAQQVGATWFGVPVLTNASATQPTVPP
jgi:hypothetical protein